MTTEDPAERQQREETVFEIQNHIKTPFPQFTDTDRQEFDTYDKKTDTRDSGQLLTFFTEQGRNSQDPSLMFIFRGQAFTLNYYNSPEPNITYTHRHLSNSLYGRRQRSWEMRELDFALERAQIHMEGVDVESDIFRNQLVGWNEVEQRFMTMQERRNIRDDYVTAEKSAKTRIRKQWQLSVLDTIWNMYDQTPERAKELALARITANPLYKTFQGAEIPSEEIGRQIIDGTASGEHALLREMYKIESYERLLKDYNLL